MHSFPELLTACKQLAEVFREKPELYTLLTKLQEKNEKELLATLNAKKIDDAYHGVNAVITFSDGGKRDFAQTLGVLKELFNKSSDASAKAIVAKVDELSRGRSTSLESQASQQAEGDIVLNREFVPKYYAEDVVVETQAEAAMRQRAEMRFSKNFLTVLKIARQQYIEGLPAEERAGGRTRTQILVQNSMAAEKYSLQEFVKFFTNHKDYVVPKVDLPVLRSIPLLQRKTRTHEDSYSTVVMDVLRGQYRSISSAVQQQLGPQEFVNINSREVRDDVENARRIISERYGFNVNALKYGAEVTASLADVGQEIRDHIFKDFREQVANPIRTQVDKQEKAAEAKAKQQSQAQAATRPAARA